VLIRTGVPSLILFKDNIIGIGWSLLAIAIEIEKIVKRFFYNKLRLSNTRWHFWFNILRRLEDIGLEDLE